MVLELQIFRQAYLYFVCVFTSPFLKLICVPSLANHILAVLKSFP